MQVLAGTATRVRARLELQVAMLEGTALAVAARQASAVVDQADALAPLADRLNEVGRTCTNRRRRWPKRTCPHIDAAGSRTIAADTPRAPHDQYCCVSGQTRG